MGYSGQAGSACLNGSLKAASLDDCITLLQRAKYWVKMLTRECLQGQGDLVTACLLPDQPQQVLIERIEGDGGRLPLEASKNCAGIAALETLKALGYPPFGVSLSLIKVYSGVHTWLKTGVIETLHDSAGEIS